jgi:hypothetical protein
MLTALSTARFFAALRMTANSNGEIVWARKPVSECQAPALFLDFAPYFAINILSMLYLRGSDISLRLTLVAMAARRIALGRGFAAERLKPFDRPRLR